MQWRPWVAWGTVLLIMDTPLRWVSWNSIEIQNLIPNQVKKNCKSDGIIKCNSIRWWAGKRRFLSVNFKGIHCYDTIFIKIIIIFVKNLLAYEFFMLNAGPRNMVETRRRKWAMWKQNYLKWNFWRPRLQTQTKCDISHVRWRTVKNTFEVQRAIVALLKCENVWTKQAFAKISEYIQCG